MIQNHSEWSVTISDAGTIQEISGDCLRTTGESAGELVQREFYSLIAPEDVAKVRDCQRRVRGTTSLVGLHFALQQCGGGVRHLEAIVRSVYQGTEWNIRDVTDRIALEQNFALWDRALDAATTSFVISDARLPDCPLVYVNPAFERMTGYARGEILGRNCRFLQRDDVHQPGLAELRRALKQQRPCRVVLRNYTKEGKLFWNDFTLSPIFDSQGILTHFIGVQSEITQQKLLEAQLSHAAFHDALTDLPNRLMFHDRLNTELRNHPRHPGETFAVMLFDLDRFKLVNDTLGHGAGDQFLLRVAERLQASTRNGDVLARLGGDEFALMSPGITSMAQAEQIAGRILAALDQPLLVDGRPLPASMSIGVAIARPEHGRVDEVLSEADAALYRAKRWGGGRVALFDEALQTSAASRLQLEVELRSAVEHEEFRVLYQPIVCFESGRTSRFEALIRWQHPGRGLLAPNEFLLVAEESCLIVPIGRLLQQEVCRQLKVWRELATHPDLLSVSINVAAREFEQPDFVDKIVETLQEFDIPARNLRLELTEGVIMESPDSARAKLQQLRQLGLHVKIDDFGTGHSSLARLQTFPVDSLKIDKSFVDNIEADKTSLEIVRSITAMAHTMGLVVVAEGVETAGQAEILRQFGCEYGQGYLFARPLTADRVPELFNPVTAAEHSEVATAV